MYAMALASGKPSALVDWNNNYGDDPDKAVVFHCSNLPNAGFSDIPVMDYQEIIAGTVGADNTYGTMYGRVKADPFTFCRVSTDDSMAGSSPIVGEGDFTNDPMQTFGGYGVVRGEQHAEPAALHLRERLRAPCGDQPEPLRRRGRRGDEQVSGLGCAPASVKIVEMRSPLRGSSTSRPTSVNIMHRRFMQVDVFSDELCGGNPLAVVVDAEGLDNATLQRFANWTNLSETTFLLPPTRPAADYRVRIFTTTTELPFAGHPTLGSCHAWLAAGGTPKMSDIIVQECGLGLIPIRRFDEQLAFAAPPLRKTGPLDESLLQRLITGLGLMRSDVLDHQWLVNGPEWIGLHLSSASWC